jgi:hypothetical protein
MVRLGIEPTLLGESSIAGFGEGEVCYLSLKVYVRTCDDKGRLDRR